MLLGTRQHYYFRWRIILLAGTMAADVYAHMHLNDTIVEGNLITSTV
jgi:hypothetical protein